MFFIGVQGYVCKSQHNIHNMKILIIKDRKAYIYVQESYSSV